MLSPAERSDRYRNPAGTGHTRQILAEIDEDSKMIQDAKSTLRAVQVLPLG